MKFKSEAILDNVKIIAKKRGIRIGDLEAAAGISRGYLARISKADSLTLSIEKMSAIAETLGVTIDYLLNYQETMITPNEQLVRKFIDALSLKTNRKELLWERDALSMITRKSFSSIETSHPLCETYSEEDPEIIGRFIFSILYTSYFENDNLDWVNDGFHAAIGADSVVYLTNVYSKADGAHKQGDIEIYLVHSKDPHPICSTAFLSDETASALFSLYQTVMRFSHNIGLDIETKDIISKFILEAGKEEIVDER